MDDELVVLHHLHGVGLRGSSSPRRALGRRTPRRRGTACRYSAGIVAQALSLRMSTADERGQRRG
ncbi:MAG: hypothetical protein MZV64_11345 [Ignavibacteriales bacterium]|nr:hypothetical protein [Ignavibacteriales bacterium]